MTTREKDAVWLAPPERRWGYIGITAEGTKEAGQGLTLAEFQRILTRPWAALDTWSYAVQPKKAKP